MAKSLKDQELEYNRAVKARLKQLRALRGWTQEDIAHLLEIEPDAYQQIETRKKSKVSMWLANRIEFLTGIRIGDIGSPISPPQQPPPSPPTVAPPPAPAPEQERAKKIKPARRKRKPAA